MNTFTIINILILLIILIACYFLLYRLNLRIDIFYVKTSNATKKISEFIYNFEKLESLSLAWLFTVLIYKYLICPIRHINTDWFNKQIWIAVILYLIIEVIGIIFMLKITKKR